MVELERFYREVKFYFFLTIGNYSYFYFFFKESLVLKYLFIIIL